MCLAAGGGLMHIDLLVKYLPVAVLYSDHMERDSDLVVRSVRNTRPTGERHQWRNLEYFTVPLVGKIHGNCDLLFANLLYIIYFVTYFFLTLLDFVGI